jgi:hypothetical protein
MGREGGGPISSRNLPRSARISDLPQREIKSPQQGYGQALRGARRRWKFIIALNYGDFVPGVSVGGEYGKVMIGYK